MLLKIMTTYNSEVVIDAITNAEIHRARFFFHSDSELHDTLTKGPGVIRACGLSPSEIVTFDEPIDGRKTGQSEGVGFSFVDYERAGRWHRVAIECFAYLCNDDGKTISKIGAA